MAATVIIADTFDPDHPGSADWVALPLDLLLAEVRKRTPEALAELARRMGLDTARRYSPSEPRDSHGRWTGPGMNPDVEAGAKAAEENMQAVLDRSKASGNFEKDRRWYDDAHDLVGEHAAAAGVDPARFAGMVAVTSPHCSWQTSKSGRLLNIELAEKAAATARAYPGLPGAEVLARVKAPGMMKNSLSDAVDVFNGAGVDEVSKGPKVRSFYNNLVDPRGDRFVTVDTHMARAMAGDRSLNAKGIANFIGKRSYGWSADRIRAVAKANGISPAEAQAAVWSQWIREAT